MKDPERTDAPRTLADHLLGWIDVHIAAARGTIPLLCVSGAQGAGKSTAVKRVAALAPASIAILSIDDVYLERAARACLATDVHPLFATRGPPGTHDLHLLFDTIDRLCSAGAMDATPLPSFDKAADDRRPREDWAHFTGRPDAIVLEGWLMGVAASPRAAELDPINAIERLDDQGVWRAYQEHQLSTHYAALWDAASAFFHIDAPSFDVVLSWRLQQEASNLGVAFETMDAQIEARITRFIQHYERLTRRMLRGRRRPGARVAIDGDRRVLAGSGAPF